MKVIVTGASGGIGRGIAEVLARKGMQIGLIARNEEALNEVTWGIQANGGTAIPCPCDLRDHEQTAFLMQELIERMGGIDALINNAGLVIRKDIFEISLEEWQDMLDTNIGGVFHATRAVIAPMKEQGHGHIINISSISGKVPLVGASAYAATKYAVTGFSQSLFHELRDFGIKVSTVFPGSVDSQSHRHDPGEDHTWKVSPEEVGKVCADILHTREECCIHEVEILPSRKGGN